MKNILVIGESVFAGRVFSILASKSNRFHLHIVNRGNYPLRLDNATQYICNWNTPHKISKLVPDMPYDALIDFSAYSPGVIKSLIEAIGDRVKQYIFLSTTEVYAQNNGYLDENAPLCDISHHLDDLLSEYIDNKIVLEQELIESCVARGIKYTILRPAIIYGPYNNSPRESYLIRQIEMHDPILLPVDAKARFNFVYVADVAGAIMKSIGDERAYDQVFNLAGSEVFTYPQLISAISSYCKKKPIETREIKIAQIYEENIPLTFPLTEDKLFDGRRFENALDFSYTSFTEGMAETYRSFLPLYTTYDA